MRVPLGFGESTAARHRREGSVNGLGGGGRLPWSPGARCGKGRRPRLGAPCARHPRLRLGLRFIPGVGALHKEGGKPRRAARLRPPCQLAPRTRERPRPARSGHAERERRRVEGRIETTLAEWAALRRKWRFGPGSARVRTKLRNIRRLQPRQAAWPLSGRKSAAHDKAIRRSTHLRAPCELAPRVAERPCGGKKRRFRAGMGPFRRQN